jgi:hypothetical protein
MNHELVPVQACMRYALCLCGGRLTVERDAPVLMSLPAQYWHACESCGERKTLREMSPSMTYEVIN